MTTLQENSTKHGLENEGWTLLIRDTTPDDARRYSCRAKNIAGEAEKRFNVQILGEFVCLFLFSLIFNLFSLLIMKPF